MNKEKIINKVKVAVCQFDVKILDKDNNLKKMEKLINEAKNKNNVDLVVFPEASITGYCFKSVDEILNGAISNDSPEVKYLSKLAGDLNISIIFGAIEIDEGKIYNTAFLVEPNSMIYKYHKAHLPFMGADKFVERGNELEVFETRFGKIGLIICYDLRFPETARVLSLKGARLIIQPTNLSLGGESHMDYFGRARACENRVYLISCNRCGLERGFKFFGRSQIIDYAGKILAEATNSQEIIYSELDLSLAEEKNIIVIPNDYETHLFEDRNPEIYKAIAYKTNEKGFAK